MEYHRARRQPGDVPAAYTHRTLRYLPTLPGDSLAARQDKPHSAQNLTGGSHSSCVRECECVHRGFVDQPPAPRGDESGESTVCCARQMLHIQSTCTAPVPFQLSTPPLSIYLSPCLTLCVLPNYRHVCTYATSTVRLLPPVCQRSMHGVRTEYKTNYPPSPPPGVHPPPPADPKSSSSERRRRAQAPTSAGREALQGLEKK